MKKITHAACGMRGFYEIMIYHITSSSQKKNSKQLSGNIYNKNNYNFKILKSKLYYEHFPFSYSVLADIPFTAGDWGYWVAAKMEYIKDEVHRYSE